ncbi:hypothetical protein ABZW03_38180 [Kitasatospora sp. NPDC004799]|uniref:hypothetical protein n=1 Tax=Kitasatospora sp. NPDC004799 TaxID=3154460 RepID=UPI0033B0AB1B
MARAVSLRSSPSCDRLLGELETVAATDAVRRGDALYLLDDLGLRRVRWERP